MKNGGMSAIFRTRFAPSPTGYLHIGHAYAAMKAFQAAEKEDGTCLLRLEDIDQTRCRPKFETAIFEDLGWLGMHWPVPVRRQSDHFSDFEAVLSALQAKGVVYRSFLSRKEINTCLDRAGVEASPAGERPFSRHMTLLSGAEESERSEQGAPFAWRLCLAACREYLQDEWLTLGYVETGKGHGVETGWVKARPEWLGDVILARKDTPTSYHVAVCHDDMLQGISHVVRGRDLMFATHVHVLIQKLMGWPTPVYAHHGLMTGADGRKFSKSDSSKTLRSLRKEGVKPEDVFNLVEELGVS